MSDVQLTSESLPYVMVQLSVSVRSHRVGLLALFATPVIGAESGKAQLASRGRAPAVERMRLVSDDVAPPPDAGGLIRVRISPKHRDRPATP